MISGLSFRCLETEPAVRHRAMTELEAEGARQDWRVGELDVDAAQASGSLSLQHVSLEDIEWAFEDIERLVVLLESLGPLDWELALDESESLHVRGGRRTPELARTLEASKLALEMLGDS